MNDVSKVIFDIASKAGWQRNLSRARLWKKWPDIAGRGIARYAVPLSFQKADRKEVLIVAVADSVWMHELSMQRLELLNNINAELGSDGFDEIRFVVGELPQSSTFDDSHDDKLTGGVIEELQCKAHQLCENINDQGLKSAFEHLYLSHQLTTYKQARSVKLDR